MVLASWSAAFCRLDKRYHLRVEMGGSPLDRVHKYGIGTALVLAKGPVPSGKAHSGMSLVMFSGTAMTCCWSFSLQQASMATRNEPCAPLLRAFTAETESIVVSVYEHPLAYWLRAPED
eukprot:1136833-Pelagomonas_calceolata.AAC.1